MEKKIKEITFGAKDSEMYKFEYTIPEGYEAEIKDGKVIVKKKKDSEDEMSRKWILEYLYDGLRKADEQFKDHFKAAIAYLEKQKEQKPAEWSEEDDNALVLFHELISFGYTERFCDAQTAEDMRRWLNERLKSTRPQSVQDKFDEAMHVADKFEEGYKAGVYDTKAKSWKPSEEQIKWLKDVIETVPMTCRQQIPLESLYNDLKKLM